MSEGSSTDWQSFFHVKLNWTIVQFNLGLPGFTKAYKAFRLSNKKKVAGVLVLAFIALFFLLLCFLKQYDTQFTCSVMNQGLAKKFT